MDIPEGGCAYTSAAHGCAHAYLVPPVLDVLRSWPDVKDVLDAGCGNGSVAGEIQDSGYNVYGCDLSPSGIEVARSRWPQPHFVAASVYEDLLTPFGRRDRFDAVVSLEVIEHLFAPRAFLDRVHEALRPGGVLVLSTPYHGYVKNLALALSGRLDAHFTALWDGGHIKFWSRKTITRLLEDRGFEVVSFKGVGRVPLLWKSMLLVVRRAPGA